MTQEPVASTPAGRYHGMAAGATEVFRGIRYAQPPVGPLRLRPPQPLPRTTAVVDATRFGPAPPQVPPAYLSDVTDFDEDCLTLNIWRPRERTGSLPVLVWLYGGGFKSGATSGQVYDGTALAHEVLVVTVNYRVGALGFGTFAHADPSLAGASNLGLRDVIASLQWIQDNVADFGGDPERVCVAGQSAGGFLAGALPAAPSARGLYRRLIPMSGGPYKIIDTETAVAQGDVLLRAVGISAVEATAGRLRDVAVEDWLAAESQVTAPDVGDRNGTRIIGFAVVDDSGLPDGLLAEHPMESLGRSPTELLLTVTSHEAHYWRRLGSSQFREISDAEDLIQDLVQWGMPADRAPLLVEHYLGRAPVPADAREVLLTDWIFQLPQARAALAASQGGGRAWIAEHRVPEAGPTGHFDDVPHLFGTATDRTAAQRQFAELAREAVRTFCASGDPGWEPFDTPDAGVRVIADSAADMPGRLTDTLSVWRGIDRR